MLEAHKTAHFAALCLHLPASCPLLWLHVLALHTSHLIIQICTDPAISTV